MSWFEDQSRRSHFSEKDESSEEESTIGDSLYDPSDHKSNTPSSVDGDNDPS